MSEFNAGSAPGPLAGDVHTYTAAFEAWLAARPPAFVAAARPIPSYAERVAAMSELMRVLFDEGWARRGWPEEFGGLGGGIAYRAAMWEALARHGLGAMALFEHLEILAPTLLAMGRRDFAARVLPRFLRGDERWSQGFSEPEAGSDLASVRTRATADGDGYVISGRKIWTSWARYASWCLVLARTGTRESRHRGLTAFAVDLRSPGVEVRAIEQANGTDELAEVTLEGVRVPSGQVVGEVGGGWKVAMHILAHERGTFAWFRHCFLYRQLFDGLRPAAEAEDGGPRAEDGLLGEALLDLAAVRASSHVVMDRYVTGTLAGPEAAFSKLLLAAAEQSVNDWSLADDTDLAIGLQDEHAAVRRQDYLFSRIVTVYGGSQQMQLDTIAKQILRLP
ncbi:acyl-CoA dehydrogenase family protein [Actinomadura rugatobispora]|uniref:Acyl-CoA dehydrogenase family protein n=1 Tax=Actinomadura rugatobispora TaxID=1994 RepID=A0ABW1AIU2_9ACTN|nr:acyl-CoA dehydrogenase family protein [Actinomadura rugatobispora]